MHIDSSTMCEQTGERFVRVGRRQLSSRILESAIRTNEVKRAALLNRLKIAGLADLQTGWTAVMQLNLTDIGRLQSENDQAFSDGSQLISLNLILLERKLLNLFSSRLEFFLKGEYSFHQDYTFVACMGCVHEFLLDCKICFLKRFCFQTKLSITGLKSQIAFNKGRLVFNERRIARIKFCLAGIERRILRSQRRILRNQHVIACAKFPNSAQRPAQPAPECLDVLASERSTEIFNHAEEESPNRFHEDSSDQGLTGVGAIDSRAGGNPTPTHTEKM